MSLSHAQLRRWYRAYNARWFGGRLQEDIDVFYAPQNDAIGKLCLEDNEEHHIVIDTKLADTNYDKFTLLHEMNHLDTGDYTHGRRFQAGMLRLAKEGAFRRIW